MGLNYIEEILCAKDLDSSICTEITIENLLTLLFLRNGHPDPGAGPDGSVRVCVRRLDCAQMSDLPPLA